MLGGDYSGNQPREVNLLRYDTDDNSEKWATSVPAQSSTNPGPPTMLVIESLNTNFVAFKLDAEVNIAAQSISSGGFSLIKDLGGTDQILVYGMDYNEHFRSIRHIYWISQKGIEAFKE